MQDFLVYMSLTELYQSSKSREWRKQVKDRQAVIFKFLQDNGLSKVPLLDSCGDVSEDFELRSSHLVEEGIKLFAKAVPAWQRAGDRDGKLSNIYQLENGFKKLRADK
ncbi:hypothetical protein [Xanthomonas medicagonis]|uniref:hypothetical protein n=1 Tax=Xanthomonas medicagonis TaxID=3160841 RepID=UPI003519B247